MILYVLEYAVDIGFNHHYGWEAVVCALDDDDALSLLIQSFVLYENEIRQALQEPLLRKYVALSESLSRGVLYYAETGLSRPSRGYDQDGVWIYPPKESE